MTTNPVDYVMDLIVKHVVRIDDELFYLDRDEK